MSDNVIPSKFEFTAYNYKYRVVKLEDEGYEIYWSRELGHSSDGNVVYSEEEVRRHLFETKDWVITKEVETVPALELTFSITKGALYIDKKFTSFAELNNYISAAETVFGD